MHCHLGAVSKYFFAVITGVTKTTSDITAPLTELEPVFYLVSNFLLGQKTAAVTDRSPLASQIAESN